MACVKTRRGYYIFFLLILIISCNDEASMADLIIHNANIWTGNDVQPSADALAVSGDTIIAIGRHDDVLELKGPETEVIDGRGKFIVPGFIDCHVHLITGGRSLLSVDLRDAATPQEFIRRVAEYAKTLRPGEWILEGNWDHTLWGGELPHRNWVDSVTPDNPLFLSRLDGHMALANSLALQFAEINKDTPEVDGGEIIKDAGENLTGILKDNAMSLVFEEVPPMNEAQRDKAFDAAMKYFLENGVTSVHDVDGLNGDVESYSTALRFRQTGDLQVRIYAATPIKDWRRLAAMPDESDSYLRTDCLKGFVDGSLGSHTAAFHEHYTDKADDKGFFINSEENLNQWILDADRAGLHLFVHAIGDSANHTLLNIFEEVIRTNEERDRRFRIEHAQHLAREDISRFQKLGVIASMQPYHAIDDGRWAEAYIGPERIKTTYAFQSLLDEGAILAFGSDWAVAPASPLMGIYAAVTRRTLDDQNPDGWVPEQKITVEEALRAYTKNAAYASFEENIKGTLEAGKLADFVLLSENITEIDPNKIKNVQVLQTYVGGKKVFELN